MSLAPTDAVVGTADPVTARLWYLPTGLAEVEATSLVTGTFAGISIYLSRQLGHLAVESPPRIGEVK